MRENDSKFIGLESYNGVLTRFIIVKQVVNDVINRLDISDIHTYVFYIIHTELLGRQEAKEQEDWQGITFLLNIL